MLATKTTSYKASNGKSNRMINLTRRETDILISGYSIKYRAAIVDRWHKLEKKAGNFMPQNFAQALRLAADQQEIIQAQQEQMLLNAPKVALMEAMEAEELAISIGDWAKLLSKANKVKIGPVKLMSFLREQGLLMTGRDANERNKPYQIHIEAGTFDVRYNRTPAGVKVQPLVTTKGQMKYAELVVDNFRTE